MRNNVFAQAVRKERLKLLIAANCRSDLPVRNKGMEVLASGVGVFSSPKTIEMDLIAYVEQVDSFMVILELFNWVREVSTEHCIGELPQSIPQFQLELV